MISPYDLLGKHVLEISPSNQINNYSLDISNLNAGIYNLNIKTTSRVVTEKIIKQ